MIENKEIPVGTKGSREITVRNELSAKSLGSGSLMVYGTPALVALMEETALKSIEMFLEPGLTTVGININVDHVAASPMGMTVRCESTLVKVDGRALTFEIEAYDKAGLIGKASHKRFIVKADSFQDKTDSKL